MINEKNLIKLRDYVKNNVTQEMFDMDSFRGYTLVNYKIPISKKEYFAGCGTVGCLLGYIIHAIPEINLSKGVEWSDLSKEYLGISDGEIIGDFLFDGSWADYPEFNTPAASVKRIDILLKHGPIKIEEVIEQNCGCIVAAFEVLR